jgi:hypothetical protein
MVVNQSGELRKVDMNYGREYSSLSLDPFEVSFTGLQCDVLLGYSVVLVTHVPNARSSNDPAS